MFLVGSEIVTAAGFGKDCLWKSLVNKIDHSCASNEISWGKSLPFSARVCMIEDQNNFEKRFQNYFKQLWAKLADNLSAETHQQLEQSKIGIIFSSTKGFHEDFIWDFSPSQEKDAFYSIPLHFGRNILRTQPERVLCISHACASTHISLEKSKFWLENRVCDFVFVLSGDLIGPFVFRGFQTLKILSEDCCRPFAEDRNGLQLGEACGLLLFSAEALFNEKGSLLKIASLQSNVEGTSVTRPSENGLGLFKAIEKTLSMDSANPIDLVIAHGTGTVFNDLSEERAFAKFEKKVSVTGCKWSVGHTLGASGSVDVIAASMVLENNLAFPLANTREKNSGFSMDYLTLDYFEKHQKQWEQKKYSNLLVTSLGFGGVHSALVMKKVIH